MKQVGNGGLNKSIRRSDLAQTTTLKVLSFGGTRLVLSEHMYFQRRAKAERMYLMLA